MLMRGTPEYLEIDDSGRLVIPAELVKTLGLKKGSRLPLIETEMGLELLVSTRLRKLYIEPTNLCNLDCLTCMRNDWNEPMGKMSKHVFKKIVEGLDTFKPVPSVFFGGIGEPLLHPRIVEMVKQVKSLGTSVELITNGTLLTKEMSQQLVRAGLDTLWVSLDGAKPESYADVRLGAALPQIIENLKNFYLVTLVEGYEGVCGPMPITQLGIAFVAMKRNIADLPDVINIGHRAGAKYFSVSNVLPYNSEMLKEVLYNKTINNINTDNLILPEIDIDEITRNPLYEAAHNMFGSGVGINSSKTKNRCPFIENGSGAISWEGNFSPCLPLMHNHTSYIGFLSYEKHYSQRWIVGNIKEKGLDALWNAPEHLTFRERVKTFDFSPCTDCGGCELAEKNDEDCFGNKFPTCGGCLWAQGVIQCP
jgi:MoaA/NifB/PqqE/SkfB family radical SAM enzyme